VAGGPQRRRLAPVVSSGQLPERGLPGLVRRVVHGGRGQHRVAFGDQAGRQQPGRVAPVRVGGVDAERDVLGINIRSVR
jgi:hypothetical protein